MTREEIIAAIDDEIGKLEKVRELLQATGTTGRSGASTARKSSSASTGTTKKRNLSPEARARIAAAQKRRWAKQKAAATQNGKK